MIGEVSWNCYYSPWYLLMLIDTFPWFNFTGAWYIETIYPWYHEPMSHPHGRVKGVACNCWYCPWYLNRLIDILPWSNHTHLWYIECLLILVPMNLWPPWEGGRRVMELLLLPMVSEQCGRYIPTADCTGPFMRALYTQARDPLGSDRILLGFCSDLIGFCSDPSTFWQRNWKIMGKLARILGS